ncbi:glycosidase [Mahella sp.]|uniref:glycoside hydrolase family 130 protein n=1 Tax=Mahella sp. TaxID=2798721 RepID=UPI0025C68CBA|nr:glycosidase [Mahella sp.]MBZ4665303.1 glycosidase related protein [Mahella sp.]
MIKLERLTDQPILRPRQEYEWERSAVFNAAVIYHEGLFHLLYRTTDNPPHAKYGTYISRIGYAVSSDGINFYRGERPIFEGEHVQEQRGVEDPRVVKIDDIFYMTYTGFGGRFEGDYRIMMAYSKNLVQWERMGVVMDEPNKDAALFPEKIGGRYVMFHRRYPNIWVAFSDDLIHWTDHHEVIKIRPGTWESARVGIAGPPVFSCGQAEVGDDIWLYYGGADTVIGVTKTSKQKLKFA